MITTANRESCKADWQRRNFRYYLAICLGRLREPATSLCPNKNVCRRDMNQGPPEYGTRVLTNHSVTKRGQEKFQNTETFDLQRPA
jgi:hypothetical protein